jgi:hypothetical protein
LGVANGFYSKLQEDRRDLSERIKAERSVAEAAVHSKREYVCTDLVNVTDPKLSDYVKRRYGKLSSIGRPSRARKASYYVGKKVGENIVLHRGSNDLIRIRADAPGINDSTPVANSPAILIIFIVYSVVYVYNIGTDDVRRGLPCRQPKNWSENNF